MSNHGTLNPQCRLLTNSYRSYVYRSIYVYIICTKGDSKYLCSICTQFHYLINKNQWKNDKKQIKQKNDSIQFISYHPHIDKIFFFCLLMASPVPRRTGSLVRWSAQIRPLWHRREPLERERQKRPDVRSSVCDTEEHSWTSEPERWDRGARGGGWERRIRLFLFFSYFFLHTGDEIKKRKPLHRAFTGS